ncbi:MAG: SUF system NifU family Fe-S cluster assembly protein [Candidatus Ancillula sp.]|jgi:nitrogen fixation NifU-like protein|nr:SUF system NifU family Fe-S cluster assembly protein [Candidatus Ancillula sp.]
MLEEMYQEVILEESAKPCGRVDAVDDEHASHQYNPTCGDDLTVAVKLRDDLPADSNLQIIEKVDWTGQGCSISTASASIMAQLMEDKTAEQAFTLVQNFKELMDSRGQGIDQDKMDQLGDASVFVGTSKFPARIKCALLSWVAFEDSLRQKISK